MTRQDLIKFVESQGYRDNGRGSGRYIKTREDGEVVCFRISSVAIRYEVRVKMTGYDGKQKNEWLRICSAYIKNASIRNGRLIGLSRTGCQAG